MTKFGETLAAYRTGAGETQGELGAKIGVSDKAVSRWEKGETEPDYETLLKLAGHYNVSLDALFGKEPKDLRRALEEALADAAGEGTLYDRVFQLLASVTDAAVTVAGQEKQSMDPPKDGVCREGYEEKSLRVGLTTPGAFLGVMDSNAVNLSYGLFRNKENFSWVKDKAEALSSLFASLSDPDALRLFYLLSREDSAELVTAAYAAKLAGIPEEKAKTLLGGFSWSETIRLAEGERQTYRLYDSTPYLLLLSAAYLLLNPPDVNLHYFTDDSGAMIHA